MHLVHCVCFLNPHSLCSIPGNALHALLHVSEYSEYTIFKVGTDMRMDRDPPTLLGQCPKFDQIFLGWPPLYDPCYMPFVQCNFTLYSTHLIL